MNDLSALEKETLFLQETDRPIIIWGTSTAGQMAYEVCCKLNIQVRAFGDNNSARQGAVLCNLAVLSPEAVKDQYPKAVIIVGTYIYNIERAVINQLSALNSEFEFITRHWIEYYYEAIVLKRNISNEKQFLNALCDVEVDENAEWRFCVNRKNIAEYKYIVTDYICDDLYEIINRGYGIKNLYLVVSSNFFTEDLMKLVCDIREHSNVGHINLVTDGNIDLNEKICGFIKEMFFAVKIPVGCGEDFIDYLKRNGVHYEKTKLRGELFDFQYSKCDEVLTERMVCECICSYVGGRLKDDIVLSDDKVYIVQLFNGLANQMLMYLFGKMLEQESGIKVIFDDTLLSMEVKDKDVNIARISKWNSSRNTEEVKTIVNETRRRNSFYCYNRAEVAEVFAIPIRLLSDYFDEVTWGKYLEKTKNEFTGKYKQPFQLGQLLIKSGFHMLLLQDNAMPNEFMAVKNNIVFNEYALELPFHENTDTNFIVKNNKNTYYMGIWTMGEIKDWLFTNRNFARNVFPFDVSLRGQNIVYADKIKSTESVVIHIRRGDFILCNLETDNNFFKKSILQIEDTIAGKEKFYFVFSDDIDWCRNHSDVLGLDMVEDRVTYIVGNEGKNSYIDMYLMSLGKILIPSYNSTFSYMALLLSESMKKCVDVLQYRYYCKKGIDDRVEIVDV